MEVKIALWVSGYGNLMPSSRVEAVRIVRAAKIAGDGMKMIGDREVEKLGRHRIRHRYLLSFELE